MIGKETEEQPVFKVTDKRKFNIDGSLREGVEIEPEKPKADVQPPAEEPKTAAPPVENQTESSPVAEDEEEFEGEDIPGADDPASFVNFLSTLATNAIAALGGMPHPATGQRTVDLESGKFWIEVLAMLKEKTQGNLHPKEAELLDGLLGDLRMQFVQISRIAEEKLKAQAAQKFSANDILGKK
jgi:hypothetical protein